MCPVNQLSHQRNKLLPAFLLGMNDVIFNLLVLAETFLLSILFLNLSTALTTLIRSAYFQGFQLSDALEPNVPILVNDTLSTSANVEKYVALLVNCPAKKASIFMSFGSSANTNLTSMLAPLARIE